MDLLTTLFNIRVHIPNSKKYTGYNSPIYITLNGEDRDG